MANAKCRYCDHADYAVLTAEPAAADTMAKALNPFSEDNRKAVPAGDDRNP